MSKSDSETSITKSNPIIIQHEGSSFNSGIVLNETNYDLWSQMLEMQIVEKEKLSFIRGTSPPPKDKYEGYEKWYSDNQKVKRWLLMSMSPEIMKRYIRIPTAQDIWKALFKSFYDGANELQVFTLNQRAFFAKQNGRPLSVYYGELTEIFSELDHRDKVVMVDEIDIASYQKLLQRQMVHIFLVGLEGDFEQVRSEILRKDPIPELEECYALGRREDVRRGVMNGQLENSKALAMVTRNRSNQNWSPQRQKYQKRPIHPKTANGGDKSSYKCTHCDQTGHTKSRCYELVGYPEWWDHSRDSRKKNSKKASTTVIVETKTEDDSGEKSSALVAAVGNGRKVLNISTHVSNSAWIIDSGATNHMTFDSRQVSPLKSASQNSVSTANGTSILIIEEGSLSLTNTLNLDSVLVAPSLNYNLLSISQITTVLFCVVIFWPEFCVFKDIRTR